MSLVLLLGAGAAQAGPVAADVPFRLIDNRVFVPAMLNGKGPYRLVLDTGADMGAISRAVMDEIGAPRDGRLSIGGAGEGRDRVIKTRIASLAIGGAAFRDLPAIVPDFTALNDVIGFTRFDGIAGEPVFRRYVVDIDFVRGHVRLIAPKDFRPPKGAIAVPFTFYDGVIPEVRGTIAGFSGRFIVDLGDRSSLTLFGPFWRAHAIDEKLGSGVEALTGYGVGGPIRGIVVRVPRFAFGKAKVRAIVARLSLQTSGGFADPHIAGSIGTGVLKHFRTIFDYAGRRLWLVPVDSAPDTYDRAGMWLGRSGSRFKVLDVVKDGPADAAGLAAGDIVTAIDRRRTETLDLFKVRAQLADPSAGDPLLIDYLRKGRPSQATLRPRDLLPRD